MDLVERCHHTSRFTTLDKLLNRDGKKLISGHFQFSRKAFHLFKKGIANETSIFTVICSHHNGLVRRIGHS